MCTSTISLLESRLSSIENRLDGLEHPTTPSLPQVNVIRQSQEDLGFTENEDHDELHDNPARPYTLNTEEKGNEDQDERDHFHTLDMEFGNYTRENADY